MKKEIIIRHCSPTLAGLRTGNIFTYTFFDKAKLMHEIRKTNRILVPKGVCALPLRYMGNKALIYIFRPSMLEHDLSNPLSYPLLKMCGYPCKSMAGCITHLMMRLKNLAEFPHEIGLFLGYPCEDVKGFIDNQGFNYKCMGLWKVYSDEAYCQKLFAEYKECTDIYLRKLTEGKTLEQLTACI